MNTFHFIIFVLIFIIVCVIIKRINNKPTRRSINNFEGEFQNSETNTYISETIDRLMNSKFNNLRLVRSDSNENINILINDTPLGHISYFFTDPPKEYWLPCDGKQIYEEDYPDFFNLPGLKGKGKINLPNLIGRMIIGAGAIRSNGGAGKAQLKNSNSTYNISRAANNDTAFRLGNVNLHVGTTGGYDWCDSLISVQADPNSNIKLCNSRSNMPPHINLRAFIKVKQDYFKLVY